MPQPIVDLNALNRHDARTTSTVKLVLQPSIMNLCQRQLPFTLLLQDRPRGTSQTSKGEVHLVTEGKSE